MEPTQGSAAGAVLDPTQSTRGLFEQFLTTNSVHVEVGEFIFTLLLAAVLSYMLSRLYIRYGSSLSNRKAFARNFMMLTMTTMLIITIVKSSLALSLGLVGALSIVRFRAAIKEPEELAYLFLAIGIGLGLGANQWRVTAVAFLIIAMVIIFRNVKSKGQDEQNLHVTVTSHNPEKIPLGHVVETLKKNCSAVDLKRFDESKEQLEASFLVEFDDFAALARCKDELQGFNEHVRVTFLDNRGLI